MKESLQKKLEKFILGEIESRNKEKIMIPTIEKTLNTILGSMNLEVSEVKEYVPESYNESIKVIKNIIEYHVQEALKQASEKAEIIDERIVTLGGSRYEQSIDKDSILNAYLLDNIK